MARRRNLDRDTPLSAEAVADRVVEEVEVCFGQLRARQKVADKVAATMRRVYRSNDRWAAKVNRARDPRPFVYGFARHWLSSEIRKTDPAVFRALPREFMVGHELRCPSRR